MYTTIQASRRAWRIIQTEACKTYYPYYSDSMEARAVALIGRKQRAAQLLYGDSDVGLSELTGAGDDANDLIAELAKALEADESVTDLRDLFKAASHEENNRDSLWVTPEAESIILEEVGPAPTQSAREPLPCPLPAKPVKKRRRVKLADAPTDLAAPLARPLTPLPAPSVAQAVQQLALFES